VCLLVLQPTVKAAMISMLGFRRRRQDQICINVLGIFAVVIKFKREQL